MRGLWVVLLAALAVSVQGTWAQRPDVTEPSGPLGSARDAIRHGRYAEAESLLTPLASRANPNEAALELGLLLQQLGRRAEARGWLESVVGSTRDASVDALVRVGRAAHALGEFRIANEAFQDAAARAPEDVSLNVAWGRLFLDAHNRAEAAKSFQMAIDADEDSAEARLGLAEALAEDTPPAALKAAEIALDLDATLVPAHLLMAGLLLDRDERDEAVAAIDRALAINPFSLDALALRGAIAYLEGRLDDFQREVAAIDVINPRFGDAFRVAGDLAARNYRFDEAVELTRRAIEREPDDTRAHADLGMHLLRTGDEPGARVALEAAFEVDPFDQITFNLLSMMDRLDTFQTIEEDPFVVRFHPDELPVLREYALPLAHRALAEMTARYGFTPEAPILIEIFPQHDDFAVRNLGLPGMIGALGACFGRVVTMDSPTAREPGTFSWEETLWHELGHVITLQMSNNRVPRWLSEGASVYEERRASDEWGRDFEVPFAQALLEDRILSLEDLNAGFTDPQLISLAYYEASLLVEHIVDTYGQAGLSALLRAYGEGLEDEEALRQGLGVEMDELREAFDASLERTFQPIVAALSPVRGLQAAAEDAERAAELARDNPDNYLAQLTYGRLLQSEGRLDEAMAVLEKAAALVPMASGRGSPRLLMAQIAMEQKNPARASAELEALLEHDHTNVEAARELVRLLAGIPNAERARLIAAYTRIVAIDPFDPAAHARLGRLLLDEGQDTDRAIRELRVALAAGPVDRAEVHVDLAEAYLASRQPAQARRQTLAALEIAPAYERAQDLLLKIVEAQ